MHQHQSKDRQYKSEGISMRFPG